MTTDTSTPDARPVAPSRRRLLGLFAAGAGLATVSGRTAASTPDTATEESVTALFGMVPKADMSFEDFVDHLANTHAPLAKEVLAQLEVLPLAYEAVVPDAPEESPYGAVGWITFASREDWEAVASSEEWERVLDDLETFTRTDQNAVIVGDHRDNLATTE